MPARIPKWPTLLALAMMLSSRVASADDAARTADALFREGKQLAKRGDWSAACPRFAEGHRLRPEAAGILLNLANCEEQIGQLLAALAHFREARTLIGPADARAGMVEGRVSVLERRIAQVTFEPPADFPPDSRVLLDGLELPADELGKARPMNPGSHTLQVQSPGRADADLSLSLREGASLVVDVPLGDLPAAPTPKAPSQGPREEPSSDARIPVGIAVGIVGLVGVGAAVATGVMVGGEQDTVDEECDAASRRCSVQGLDAAESGQSLLVTNAVAWGVGIVGIGAGAALLISALLDADDEPVGVTVAPTQAGSTVSLQGRF